MTKRARLLVLVLAAACAAGLFTGCGYFATRPPDPPAENGVCRSDRTVAESLLVVDLRCALQASSSAGLPNYQQIIGETFVFVMDPTDASELGLDPNTSWDRTADIGFTTTMLANADTLRLTWDSLTRTSQASDLEQWTALYTVRYVPTGGAAQIYQGEALVELALPAGEATWRFTRWEDHRVQGDVAALGKLKRR
jgi:hypothetical protein